MFFSPLLFKLNDMYIRFIKIAVSHLDGSGIFPLHFTLFSPTLSFLFRHLLSTPCCQKITTQKITTGTKTKPLHCICVLVSRRYETKNEFLGYRVSLVLFH